MKKITLNIFHSSMKYSNNKQNIFQILSYNVYSYFLLLKNSSVKAKCYVRVWRICECMKNLVGSMTVNYKILLESILNNLTCC